MEPAHPGPSRTLSSRLRGLSPAKLFPSADSRIRPAYDVVFGAAIPVLLLHLDQHWLPALIGLEGSILPYRPYTSILAYACAAVLLAWIPLRRCESWLQSLAAGPLLVGGAFAGGISLIAIPLGILGIQVYGLGLLGLLVPFTAAVHASAGLRALKAARGKLAAGPAATLVLLSATVFGGATVGVGRAVRIAEIRATEVLAGRRAGDLQFSERRLRFLHIFPGCGLRALRSAARTRGSDGEPAHPAARAAWERITGLEIEDS